MYFSDCINTKIMRHTFSLLVQFMILVCAAMLLFHLVWTNLYLSGTNDCGQEINLLDSQFKVHDNDRVQLMLTLNATTVSLDEFHSLIQDPLSSACRVMKTFGGNYYSWCQYRDGDKYVCLDTLEQDIADEQCLIYSFGIGNDWTFEDAMGSLGCTVLAFDPTINQPKHQRSENVLFQPLGLSHTDEMENYYTLSSILEQNNHLYTNISYLKIDIEGAEAKGLPVWIESGALRNVKQIGMELHAMTATSRVRDYLSAFQTLYKIHSFKLISYDVNACYGRPKGTTHYGCAEVVLYRSN